MHGAFMNRVGVLFMPLTNVIHTVPQCKEAREAIFLASLRCHARCGSLRTDDGLRMEMSLPFAGVADSHGEIAVNVISLGT